MLEVDYNLKRSHELCKNNNQIYRYKFLVLQRIYYHLCLYHLFPQNTKNQ